MAGDDTQRLQPRDYVVEEYTKTVCPECFASRRRRSNDEDVFKDGALVSRNGSIWLRRWCREHGETESLYEEDAEIWRSRRGWSTPTMRVTPDRPDNFGGFPHGYRHGLPASHGQHSCILLLNVTERCNSDCSACFASAKPRATPAAPQEQPSVDEILHTAKTIIAREGGKFGALMLSGGEPTVRRDLEEIIERLLELNIRRVVLNTNGRRIATDDRFVEFLHNHRQRVELFLQFDGLRPSTHIALRGEDLAAEKRTVLKRLNDAGVFTTMVAMIRRGINEDEIGDLIQLGLETPRCSGLSMQPMFGSGRALAYDPRARATPTGVLRRLGEQTRGLVDWTDFIPLPCSHKDCCDICYLLRTRDGSWKSLPKLIGKDELRRWLHVVSNTITFDSVTASVSEMLKSGALQRVFSEQLKAGTAELVMDVARMCNCIPGRPEMLGQVWSLMGLQRSAMERAAENTFRITVKMFMDEHTFHEARIRQCCVHSGTFEDNPRRYPLCWRWLFADAQDFPGKADPR